MRRVVVTGMGMVTPLDQALILIGLRSSQERVGFLELKILMFLTYHVKLLDRFRVLESRVGWISMIG